MQQLLAALQNDNCFEGPRRRSASCGY